VEVGAVEGNREVPKAPIFGVVQAKTRKGPRGGKGKGPSNDFVASVGKMGRKKGTSTK